MLNVAPDHVTSVEGKLILILSCVIKNDGKMFGRKIRFGKPKVEPAKVHVMSSIRYDCLVEENIEIGVRPHEVTFI